MPRTNDIDRAAGVQIRALRIKRHLTQTQIADRMGLTDAQISNYENGHDRISLGRVPALCAALQVGIAEFFEGLTE